MQDACAYFVNAFTVISIVEAVRSKKGKAFIHTAATSQLGQMMVKYCQKEGSLAALEHVRFSAQESSKHDSSNTAINPYCIKPPGFRYCLGEFGEAEGAGRAASEPRGEVHREHQRSRLEVGSWEAHLNPMSLRCLCCPQYSSGFG